MWLWLWWVVVVVVWWWWWWVVVVVVVSQSVITTLLPTEHMVHVYTHSVLNDCVAESQSRGGGSHGSYMSPPDVPGSTSGHSSSLLT